MKVKSLFLSMCAIAALASCSQNDELAPGGSDASEAKVTLQLKGDGVATRAAGTEVEATEAGATAKDVTVFFFTGAGSLVGSPQYKTVTPGTSITCKTTTDATQVVVIANLGKDETTASGILAGVQSLQDLKAKSVSSIITAAGGASTVNQNKDNLYMSGIGEITMSGVTGTATVSLHFLSARINTVSIEWLTANDNQGYTTDLTTNADKWWTIKQVYLMMAQTESLFLPANATTTTWSGSLAPANMKFAGGVAWGTAPWTTAPNGTSPVQTDGYLVTNIPAVDAAAPNKISNVLGTDKSWYVFENPTTSTTPTGLIVEVNWRKVASPSEIVTKYFTIYFGENKAGGGTQPILEPGKTYDIALGLKGDFTPGGSGGGGTEDPTKPSVEANVTVTVTPAKWTTTDPIGKDFN